MTPHITVCIPTFRRADSLRCLLERLENQITDGRLTFSVVVADNDAARSAERVVRDFCLVSKLCICYCNEPEQNIALVRNRALAQAEGEFIAFIDDDEIPERDWLLELYLAMLEFSADGVLAPVDSLFEVEPPAWVLKGKFFERPVHATGDHLAWNQCRTGNVLLRRAILSSLSTAFRPEFSTAGEDMDFFRRLIEKGHTFVWCQSAAVHEVVPAARCRRSFLLKRALLRGSNFHKHPVERIRNLTKSLLAIPSYALALPVLLVCGEHLFMKVLVKLCDHVSRVCAFAGWEMMKERETH
jgi:succinoglycan biosynthesis protein ExoM